MQANRRTKTTRTGRLVTVAAAATAVLLVAHSAWNWVAGRRLAHTIRVQASAGIPMSLADVLPESVPDGRNAAVPLLQAFALLRADGVSTGAAAIGAELLRYHDGDVPTGDAAYALPSLGPDRRAAVGRLIAAPELAPVFVLLEAAAEGAPARFRIDYSQGAGVLLPHLGPLRGCVRLLATRAWVRADRGDVSGALGDLRRCLRLTRGLAYEPVIISQLARASCDGRTCHLLRAIIIGAPVKALDSARIWGLVAALEEVNDPRNEALVRAIDGERIIFGGWLFLSFLDGHGSPEQLEGLGLPKWVRYYAWYPSRPMLKVDARVYLERMAAYRAAALAGDATELRRLATDRPSVSCPLTRMILPALGSAWRAVAARQAVVQMSDLGLRLALYAQATGAYPESLTVLGGVTNAPVSPFGALVVYRREPDSFVLRSPGPDGQGAGGVEWRGGSD